MNKTLRKETRMKVYWNYTEVIYLINEVVQ